MKNIDLARVCSFWKSASSIQRMALLLLADRPTLSIDRYGAEFNCFKADEREAMIRALLECQLFNAIIKFPPEFTTKIPLSQCVIKEPVEVSARA